MNQGLPKSAQEALARLTPADEHPSPDLLNAYVEQSLTLSEKDRVANHLAVCVECRDVVFLASSAAGEQVVPAMVAVAAASVPVAAAAPAETGATRAVSPIRPPSQSWSWKWIAPLAAGLALVSGLLVERHQPTASKSAAAKPPAATVQTADKTSPATTMTPPSDSPVLMSRQAGADNSTLFNQPSASPAQPKPEVREPLQTDKEDKKSARQRGPGPQRETAELSSSPATPAMSPAPTAAKPAPAGAASQTVDVTSAAPLVIAPAQQLQDAISQSTQAKAIGRTSFAGGNEAGTELFKAPVARARWRISSEGHLERSLLADAWTRVLADQAVGFHSVSAVGRDVWAGGSDGALFHSTDAGVHWNKVVLSADGNPERAAISSIHFDTTLQGSVSADSGSTWTTSDGGKTWSKQ